MAQQDIEQMRQHIDTLEQELRDARRQIKTFDAELSDLRPLKADAVFREAGFDPATREGKLLKGLLGDAPPTVEAIKEKAEAFDILPPAAGESRTDESQRIAGERTVEAQARSEATQRIDGLRETATPVGGVRMNYADYKQLQIQNPAAAFEAMRAGQVDGVPAEIASALAHNAMERNNTLLPSGGDR